MTIKQLIDEIGTYKPTGWTYYAGHTAEAYNAQRVITNTMVLVIPNPYPLFWRDQCTEKIKIKVLFMQLMPIFDTTVTGTQQHTPWSSAEDRAAIYTTVETAVKAMVESTKFGITWVSPVKFYDSPDGATVNRQMMAEVEIEMQIVKQ